MDDIIPTLFNFPPPLDYVRNLLQFQFSRDVSYEETLQVIRGCLING